LTHGVHIVRLPGNFHRGIMPHHDACRRVATRVDVRHDAAFLTHIDVRCVNGP